VQVQAEEPSSGPRELRNRGAYEELGQMAAADPKRTLKVLDGWLAGEALLELDRSAEAEALAEQFEKNLPRSMVGQFLRFRKAQHRGDTAAARAIARDRIQRPDVSQYWWGRDATDWVLLGRMRLAAGEDAKKVMDACFERALKEDGKCEEAFEAIVELALDRGDAELAATKAREGLKRFNTNPRLYVQLGRALEWTSGKEAMQHWMRALELNSRESSARSALAEAAFRIEDSAAVQEQLSKLQAENPAATALRLAEIFLSGDDVRVAAARKAHASNAWLLHRAGALMSSRYRFTEGARLQRAALKLDPELIPAKRSLAEDLLRTGEAAESWAILEVLQKEDGYDVTTFNLLELRDRVSKFKKIETPHFEIHMEETEASVYGSRVGELLERAYAGLTVKYGAVLGRRTVVEIFPDQKDFAVRTFGVPGGDGYLGVCFGSVITAPSPASPRASGHSWEATLWHEFTHTVTLSMTHNKMPRWLSEGISVYEEQRANPAWGQRFKPRYASRLLSGKITPVESMAEPFRSGDMAELDFAYFQSGLLVDWMVEKAGMPALKALLSDISKGADAVSAMSKRFGPASKMNEEFGKYAANWALKLGGDLRFKAAEAESKGERLVYEELIAKGAKALGKKDWEGARAVLETAVAGAPAMRDSEGAYPMLARAYGELGQHQEEAQTWERGLRLMADLPKAHERLIELYTLQRAWAQVEEVSARSLGVRPMSLRVLESLLDAQEAQGQNAAAAESCRKALTLDPTRAARWNSRLGRLLEAIDPTAARQHLFDALERNPRDQKALEAFSRILGTSAQPVPKGKLEP
jgi:predicted Zn-dependent protease